jgi:hypothetical protein
MAALRSMPASLLVCAVDHTSFDLGSTQQCDRLLPRGHASLRAVGNGYFILLGYPVPVCCRLMMVPWGVGSARTLVHRFGSCPPSPALKEFKCPAPTSPLVLRAHMREEWLPLPLSPLSSSFAVPSSLVSCGRTTSYIINVAPYRNGVGYDKGYIKIDGFSEAVVTYIQALEAQNDY